MKTKRKCKRCGKVTDQPFHTCVRTKADRHRACREAIIAKLSKPDPIELGEELAEYIHRKWSLYPMPGHPATKDVMELTWELEFWREKALNP